MLDSTVTAANPCLGVGIGCLTLQVSFEGKYCSLFPNVPSGDSHDTIRKAGAEVVGVSRDGLASHQRFRTKYSLTFPLLSDPEGEISKRYQVYKMKNLYGRKSMGIERSTFIIDEKGIITGVFRKVRVDGHLEEILDSLK